MGVHGAVPELVRIHLAQALVALDREAADPRVDEIVHDVEERGHRGDFTQLLVPSGDQERSFVVPGQGLVGVVPTPQGAALDERQVQRGVVVTVAVAQRDGVGRELVAAKNGIAHGIQVMQTLDQLGHIRAAVEVEAVQILVIEVVDQGVEQLFGVAAGLQVVEKRPQMVNRFDLFSEASGLGLGAVLHRLGGNVFEREIEHDAIAFALRVDPPGVTADGDTIERRLGDVEVLVGDEGVHVTEEEGEEEGANVRAVDVGVGHDDDAVIAKLLQVEAVADAGAQGGDEGADLLVAQHLFQPGPFDVEDLALEGQDRLKSAVAAHLGGTAGGLAFDDIDLALAGVALGAVGQLSREGAALHGRLALDEVPGLAGGLAGASGGEALVDNAAAIGRVLLEPGPQGVAHDRFDVALDLGVPQLALRLALELGVGDADADHGGEPLADVLALEVGHVVFQQLVLAGVVVDDPGQGRAEPGEVRASVAGVDTVGEAEDGLGEGVTVLHGDLDGGVLHHPGDVEGLFVERVAVDVEVLDEAGDASFEVEGDLVVVPLVDERDLQAFV